MTEIRAIETKYNGYRFRSRLEARWAVFFDTLGIKYEYEPEGFDLTEVQPKNPKGGQRLVGAALWYLPDFYLPDYETYVEIKPIPKDGCSAPDTINRLLSLCLMTEKTCLLIKGTPGIGSYDILPICPHFEKCYAAVFALGRKCDRLWLVGLDEYGDTQDSLECSECPSHICGDTPTWAHLGLDGAYYASRSARFGT